MRGAWRFAIALWGAGLLLGPVAVRAQEAPPASNTPATEAIGPPQLQNFSLQGNVTRPREEGRPQPTTTAEPPAARPAVRTQAPPVRAEASRTQPPQPSRAVPSPALKQVAAGPQQLQQLTPAQPITDVPAPVAAAPAPASPSTFPPAPESDSATLSPAHGFPLLPWLLAAVALGAGGAFLFWRSRSRAAVAGGPQLDLFVPPEPEPEPEPQPQRSLPPPAPAPQPAPPPSARGVVSSGLRPWIDIAIQPHRCILTDQDATIEFELELLNSGGAPARSISIEGMIINAGPSQDEELASFFAHPPVPGNRIDIIRPIHRVNLPTQLVIPRQYIVPVEITGRQVFVPLLAFNAIYMVGSTEGQTSVSFLVGRDGNGDKLAPIRLDLGPRVFRGLGARQLPTGIRR